MTKASSQFPAPTRVLVGLGWQVHVTDSAGRQFAPVDFDRLSSLADETFARIDVCKDRLTVLFKTEDAEETSDSSDGRSLSIPWQKPVSRKSRQILIPHGVAKNEVRRTRIERRARLVSAIARGSDGHTISIPWQKPPSRKSRQILVPHGIPNEVRPTRIERRARLVSAIARGRRWLDEIVSGSITDVQQIAARQKCSVRQVNMTISLAFLAPEALNRVRKIDTLNLALGCASLRTATPTRR